jgi:hypothetical protein
MLYKIFYKLRVLIVVVDSRTARMGLKIVIETTFLLDFAAQIQKLQSSSLQHITNRFWSDFTVLNDSPLVRVY